MDIGIAVKSGAVPFSVPHLLIKALMFRQDYRINKIFLPFPPPAWKPYGLASGSESLRLGEKRPRWEERQGEFRFRGFIWKR